MHAVGVACMCMALDESNNIICTIYYYHMQHFLDNFNEEERNISELQDDSEVSKLNSGWQ